VQAVVCPGNSLQAAVNAAVPGDTIPVSGTCNENILVPNDKQRIALDGGGTAIIRGPNSATPTLNIRGKGILLRGFTITGGSSGIHVNRGAASVIDDNTIQNTGGTGVIVDELAFSVLTNNSVENNPGAGILVSEGSAARIGFNADIETVASANRIEGNAVGLLVTNGSSARAVGNTISDNTGAGVIVLRGSSADISANAIDGNGGDGIFVGENSSLQLGEDSGSSIYELPNSTTGNNAGFGTSCDSGGVVDGRQGTLTGSGGPTAVDATCIRDLVP
jgi:parallel beta-helix repeat protein